MEEVINPPRIVIHQVEVPDSDDDLRFWTGKFHKDGIERIRVVAVNHVVLTSDDKKRRPENPKNTLPELPERTCPVEVFKSQNVDTAFLKIWKGGVRFFDTVFWVTVKEGDFQMRLSLYQIGQRSVSLTSTILNIPFENFLMSSLLYKYMRCFSSWSFSPSQNSMFRST